jgi:3-oxoadipate enol-lactonase
VRPRDVGWSVTVSKERSLRGATIGRPVDGDRPGKDGILAACKVSLAGRQRSAGAKDRLSGRVRAYCSVMSELLRTVATGGRTASGVAYDDEGSGPPLVLIHAGVADRRMWGDLAAAFADRHRVIRHDLRGVGESLPPTGPWSHHTDVLDLLDELLITRAHVVGASLGAGIAVEAALARPGAVASLVLVAPGGALMADAPASFRPIWAAEVDALDRGDIDGAVEINLRAWVDGPRRSADALDPATRAFIGTMQREAFELPEWDPEGAPEHELLPPAAGRVGELDCPVLVVVGDADDPAIVAIAEGVAASARRARLVVVPGVGHMLSLERPAAFEAILGDFLADVSSGAFDGPPVAVPASTRTEPGAEPAPTAHTLPATGAEDGPAAGR